MGVVVGAIVEVVVAAVVVVVPAVVVVDSTAVDGSVIDRVHVHAGVPFR